jgi:two-component system CheB/CheR fusion protein
MPHLQAPATIDAAASEFPLTAPDPKVRRSTLPVPVPSVAGSIRDQAERLLLERYAPAYVAINLEGDIIYASARTGKYLELPPGPPTSNIYGLARKGLRLDLRAVIHKAIETSQIVVHNNISIGTNGGQQLITLIAQPMRNDDGEDRLCLVVFQDLGPLRPEQELAGARVDEEFEGATIRQLEAEVRATRERLQTTTEELESSNEELKSSNEELSSMNEELQSANEELETSKEELQSINEELQTVNAELKGRVDELSRANSDIANLLESTQIATVFLDRDLAIKSFTPAAKDVFHLVESDTGRPLAHVRSRLKLDTVQSDAERVLRTLATYEEQVENEDGTRHYIMRILPYRTVDNVIAGVVVSFIDITRITAAEREVTRLTRDLRDRVESLETLFELVPVGILVSSTDPNVAVQVNRLGARLLGDEDERAGLRPVSVPYRLYAGQGEVPFWDQPLQKAALSGRPVPATELRLVRRDGSAVVAIMQAEPLFDEQGVTRGAIAALVDISERKRAEAHQERLLNELRHRVKNILASIASLASRMLSSKPAIEEFAAAFDERLQALGRLHELLSREEWEGVAMVDLAMTVVAPYLGEASENIVLSGPAVALPPSSTTTLGMALHELASNATKYGALSVPGGRVTLSWQVAATGTKKKLSLLWNERNGPRIEAFPSMGLGTRFIVQSIDYELEGVAKLNFNPEGLRCTIEVPLHDV